MCRPFSQRQAKKIQISSKSCQMKDPDAELPPAVLLGKYSTNMPWLMLENV